MRDLRVYRGRGILVTGWKTAAWIPEGDTRGVEVFRSDLGVGAATFDGTDFYIAEQGRIYGSLGAIYRVSRTATVQIVGSLADPSAIAVHGDIVYFMLDESPDIWSVSTAGGTPRKVVVGVPYDPERGEESRRLWAHECGLIWCTATLQQTPHGCGDGRHPWGTRCATCPGRRSSNQPGGGSRRNSSAS